MIEKNYLDDIQEIIMSSNTLVLVLVTSGDCMNDPTSLETWINDTIIELDQDIRCVQVCYDEQNMPFPVPLTDCLYYFAPQQTNVLFYRTGTDIVDKFTNDVEIAFNMARGKTYDEAITIIANRMIEEHNDAIFEKESSEEKQYPPATKMLRGFAKDMWASAKRAGKNLPVLVPTEIAEQRYSICEQCPHLTEEFRCTECGCFMKRKVNIAASNCPIDKWGVFNEK
jgi:hypothetical protein